MDIIRSIMAAVLSAVTALSITACALTNEEVNEATIPLESVTTIEADLKSTDLKIRLGDENKVHYRVYKSLTPTVSDSSGKLSIVSGNGRSIRNFSKSEDNYIEVILDKKELGRIDLKASSGDILLDGFDIGGKIKTSSGNIVIKNVSDGRDLTIEASSGDVDMTDCNFKSISKKTSSGDSEFSGVKADSFKLEANSGNTEISGADVCDIESESNSGNVDIRLSGKRQDVNYDIRVNTGDIKINGGEYDDDYSENNDSDKTVKVKTSSGDIEINIS